jgi:two-component system, response regulator PdtaR
VNRRRCLRVHNLAFHAASSPQATKIIVAEDDVLVRLELADALRLDRFRVFEAADVSEAISILRSTPDVDVVIADMSMRGPQDGLELARYVRRHHPGISLVLASASRQPVYSVFDAFFAKPYSAREIAAWIRQRLARLDRSKTP